MLTKHQIYLQIKNDLISKNLEIESEDFERPWGGFFKISNQCLNKFLSIYFNDIELPFDITKLSVSPKILVVAPGKQLSWQSHERRSELWRVNKGPIGIYTSFTDVQPEEMEIYKTNDIIEIPQGKRHRLSGIDDWGIVAEIWVHKYPENPSDENDIKRIADDFGR